MGNLCAGGSNTEHRILITVPHAECKPGNPHHSCDSSAVLLASCLAEHLSADVITGTVNRDTCDLNREQCKGSAKQRMIDAIVSGKYKILIDAHSYPHAEQTDNTIFARQSKAHTANTWDADLFFVVNDSDELSKHFFARVMAYVRAQQQHKSQDLRLCAGNDKLDLIRRGHQAGLYSVLIEVGEHLTKDQVADLAASICAGLHQKNVV